MIGDPVLWKFKKILPAGQDAPHLLGVLFKAEEKVVVRKEAISSKSMMCILTLGCLLG